MPEAASIARRLLDIKGAAEYLGVSHWTVRDYIASGKIRTVPMPALTPRDGDRPRASMRRVLVDRVDLDAFVDSLKSGM
jgi:hypothetical protein